VRASKAIHYVIIDGVLYPVSFMTPEGETPVNDPGSIQFKVIFRRA
jgi:hypothetical protein